MLFETHDTFLSNLYLVQTLWNNLVSSPFYIERNLRHKIITQLRHVRTEVTSLAPQLILAYSVAVFLLWEPVLSPFEGFKTVLLLEKNKKNTSPRRNIIHTEHWCCLNNFFIKVWYNWETKRTLSLGFVPRLPVSLFELIAVGKRDGRTCYWGATPILI